MPNVIYLVYRRPPRLMRQSAVFSWQDYAVGAVWVGMILTALGVMWWGIAEIAIGLGRLARYVWG